MLTAKEYEQLRVAILVMHSPVSLGDDDLVYRQVVLNLVEYWVEDISEPTPPRIGENDG